MIAAIYNSLDRLTAADIEDFYGTLDDSIIIDLWEHQVRKAKEDSKSTMVNVTVIVRIVRSIMATDMADGITDTITNTAVSLAVIMVAADYKSIVIIYIKRISRQPLRSSDSSKGCLFLPFA